MKQAFLHTAFIGFLCISPCVSAQVLTPTAAENTTPTPPSTTPTRDNTAFWQASFQNGGHYMVRLGHINSISRHEYIANGSARVTEITIATNASVVARFYWLEPAAANSTLAAIDAAKNRVTQTANTAVERIAPGSTKIQVVKDYPQSTHAHTVEYALQSKETLAALYTSLTQALDSGLGSQWMEPGN